MENIGCDGHHPYERTCVQLKKRHTETIIAAVIAVFGLAIIIIGVVMGGRPGSFYADGGRLIYQNSSESFDVGAAPGWMENLGQITILGFGPADNGNAMEKEYKGKEEGSKSESIQSPNHNNQHSPGFNGATKTVVSGETFDLSGYDKFDIDVDFGHVTIESGDSPQLYIDGLLTAEVWTENGVLKIKSDYNNSDVSEKSIGGIIHYFKNGEDITTTFTVTLPERIDVLDANLGTGSMEISSLTANKFLFDVDMGSGKANGVTAEETELQVDMGSISVSDHNSVKAYLDCNLGYLNYNGDVTGSLAAKCSMGSLKADVSEPGRTAYDINNSMGSIVLGGDSFGFSSDSKQEGGDVMFSLNCEFGSIIVKFK